MSRVVLVAASVVLLFLQGGCNRKSAAGEKIEPYIPDAGSVPFDLRPLDGSHGQQCWLATYTAEGRTARFRIELSRPEDLKDTGSSEFKFKFGKGRLVPQPGSDAISLLAALQKALEAKAPHKSAQTKVALPFEYVNFGDNLTQATGGGFGGNNDGHWTAMKLFLAEGDQECEVFLNLNSKLHMGQFSIKDPEYGDMVLAELSKVL